MDDDILTRSPNTFITTSWNRRMIHYSISFCRRCRLKRRTLPWAVCWRCRADNPAANNTTRPDDDDDADDAGGDAGRAAAGDAAAGAAPGAAAGAGTAPPASSTVRSRPATTATPRTRRRRRRRRRRRSPQPPATASDRRRLRPPLQPPPPEAKTRTAWCRYCRRNREKMTREMTLKWNFEIKSSLKGTASLHQVPNHLPSRELFCQWNIWKNESRGLLIGMMGLN